MPPDVLLLLGLMLVIVGFAMGFTHGVAHAQARLVAAPQAGQQAPETPAGRWHAYTLTAEDLEQTFNGPDPTKCMVVGAFNVGDELRCLVIEWRPKEETW